MDMPATAAAAAAQGRRCSPVVDRKLDELCACLEDALSSSSRQRRSRPYYSEERLRAEIKAKTDFLRSLLAAEAECHGGGAGARRPEHLAEAEARFAVLEATFDQWARRPLVDAPAPIEEYEEDDDDDGDGCSGSSCSCTDSCHEAKEGDAKRDTAVDEARGEDGTTRDGDGIAEDDDDDAVAKKEREAAAEEEKRRGRRWWRPSAAAAAWCGAAGVVAVVAAVGLAVELLAAVAHHNVSVYVVPT